MTAAYGHGGANHSDVTRITLEFVWVTPIVFLKDTKGEGIACGYKQSSWRPKDWYVPQTGI